ncbi:AAA family ATPase [Priestia megaterium]|uniref:AAA family ATPase n=1 Tax=Priestia megaterium TaxID=1404 RepID=A0ABD4WMU1_PRIMG|nr:AAA family ATPase [Priestia megaterium]MDD9781522.1 AAA family ATPase [Priestia megaterium]
MRIISVNLKNYKSISDTNQLKTDSKINIFAGKNNTGKTSLIEALYMIANGQIQKCLEADTACEIELSLNHEDLKFLNTGSSPDESIWNTEKIRIYFLLQQTSVMIKKVEVYDADEYSTLWDNLSTVQDIEESYQLKNKNGGSVNYSKTPMLFERIMHLIKDKIVYISGSRHISEFEHTNVMYKLNIDGTNLNSFLYTLRNNNEEIFNEIKRAFIDIFPDVRSISTNIVDRSGSITETNINLYFEGLNEPIPLYSCGSGFTHVLILLSILYSGQDRIILFDEPHVFLHPSAEKAIYDLISATEYHQYFLTTHSPILINYPFNKKVFLVKKEAGISKFAEFNELQEILEDIGIKNSDLAFSDKVLFVEGKTEELVVPMILSHFGMRQIGYNYRVLDMNGTSNHFNKKSAMESYRKNLDLVLNGISNSPIPYRILIDKDEKQDEKINDIKEQYGDKVLILGRREFENYFLDCYEELSNVINASLDSQVVTSEQIKGTIEDILSQKTERYIYPRGCNNPLDDVIGSKVLDQLFRKYDISLGYDKVKHGIEIATNILENDSEKLIPIKNILEDFISAKKVEVSYA